MDVIGHIVGVMLMWLVAAPAYAQAPALPPEVERVRDALRKY